MVTLLHPFSQLTPAEITQSAEIIRNLYPGTELIFKIITLEEPDKAQALKYLEAEHAVEASRPFVERRSFAAYYKKGGASMISLLWLPGLDILHEAVISLTTGGLVYNKEMDRFVHGPADLDEVARIETIVQNDPDVQKELKKLNIPDISLVLIEPWIYGSDGIEDDRRLYQCFLFCRDINNPTEEDSNHYAHPIDVSPVVDVVQGKVTRIDFLPTGAGNKPRKRGEYRDYKAQPANEYLPKYQNLRTDLKPLRVVQPEGASFQVKENFAASHLIEWQKWRFRVGFNGREGIVLHDVRYECRPLFYRLSLSDMNIPYADPRHPYHKKAAFDLGDAGAGYMANNLQLGCDCLGSIWYLSSTLSTPSGDTIEKPNCVCIHEQDSGIGWKHTNYRTDVAVVTRARELVLQSIMTVANYEYIVAFIFTQAGDVVYEVRATGILSTQPIDEGVKVPWGTVVHPGVLAAHHQHIFSLRIDPMLDGLANRLIYEEAHPMARDPDLNPHGTGYYTKQTTVQSSGGHDLGHDLDVSTNRTFKIINKNSLNPVNQQAVGYKIMVPEFQKLLADKETFHYKRAEFADHNIYVTAYRPQQLYAAGQYTNQSRGGAGVRTWASRRDNVVDEDIVLWVQFGINHVPRIEDFPVMPVEIIKVQLRPVNFFTKNPALDVPPSSQDFNKSCQLTSCHSVEEKIKL